MGPQLKLLEHHHSDPELVFVVTSANFFAGLAYASQFSSSSRRLAFISELLTLKLPLLSFIVQPIKGFALDFRPEDLEVMVWATFELEES